MQEVEKIITKSSKIISKLSEVDTRVLTTQSSINIDLPSESRPAYEIFNNLEHLILFSESDDDDEIFMPSLDGEKRKKIVTLISSNSP
jgi:hypothetical protein